MFWVPKEVYRQKHFSPHIQTEWTIVSRDTGRKKANITRYIATLRAASRWMAPSCFLLSRIASSRFPPPWFSPVAHVDASRGHRFLPREKTRWFSMVRYLARNHRDQWRTLPTAESSSHIHEDLSRTAENVGTKGTKIPNIFDLRRFCRWEERVLSYRRR